MSVSENAKNWTQTVAIICAGVWVLFEFVLSENARGFDVHASIAAKLGEAYRSKQIELPVTPIYFDIELKNIGDILGQIGIVRVEVSGHVFSDSEGLPPPKQSKDDYRNIVTTSDLDWSASSKKIAWALVGASDFVSAGETSFSRPIIPIKDVDRFDMLSYSVEAHLVQPCAGIYPFSSCKDFRVELTGNWKKDCEKGYKIQNICGWFEARDSVLDDYVIVPEAEMRDVYRWELLQVGGLILPGRSADSLKSEQGRAVLSSD